MDKETFTKQNTATLLVACAKATGGKRASLSVRAAVLVPM
jgi:hypothetical protein